MKSKSKTLSENKLVRLNKFLADCGVASRRKADEMILQGRVQINGSLAHEAGIKIDPDRDQILVNRKPVRPQPKGMAIFHKPRGVVTTMSDPEGRPSVADYLGKRYRGYYPAGRLDWDSSGLVILTNDGDLAECLMHPRFGTIRVYQVKVSLDGSFSHLCPGKSRQAVKKPGLN